MYTQHGAALMLNLLLSMISVSECNPQGNSSTVAGPSVVCQQMPEVNRPTVGDCYELLAAIELGIAQPGGNRVKKFGPNCSEGPDSVRLPASFFAREYPPGRPPRTNTCEFRMGWIGREPKELYPPYDEFPMSKVAYLGTKLVFHCLVFQERIGYGLPGRYGTVVQFLKKFSPTALNAVSDSAQDENPIWEGGTGNKSIALFQRSEAIEGCPKSSSSNSITTDQIQ